jgi:hypothetical protein
MLPTQSTISADEGCYLFERDRFCGAMNFSDMTDDIGYDFTGEEKPKAFCRRNFTNLSVD